MNPLRKLSKDTSVNARQALYATIPGSYLKIKGTSTHTCLVEKKSLLNLYAYEMTGMDEKHNTSKDTSSNMTSRNSHTCQSFKFYCVIYQIPIHQFPSQH